MLSVENNVHVKICGVKDEPQAREILALGADYLGINFWPKSKRYLPLSDAQWIINLEQDCYRQKLVGLFVNADSSYLREIIQATGIPTVQLHGDESPDNCAVALDAGLRVIKAFQVRDEASLRQIADFPTACDVLLDAYHPGVRGGSGETFPWELALKFKSFYPGRRMFLAGGLTDDNVFAAVSQVRPYAVDVASGVEDMEPGRKNMAKVKRFIQAAKQAHAPHETHPT